MRQSRRGVLRTLGVVGTGALAGCSLPSSGSDSPTDGTPAEPATIDEPTRVIGPPAAATPGSVFGSELAVSDEGDVAIAAADLTPTDDVLRPEFVAFERQNGQWAEAGTLDVAEPAATEYYASRRLSLSGDGTVALVSNYRATTAAGENAGFVTVFERQAGEWVRVTDLAPTERWAGQLFGAETALSTDGTVALVSALRGADSSDTAAGAVYEFRRTDDGWVPKASLQLSDPLPQDGFGGGLGLSADGTTAVVTVTEDPKSDRNYAGSLLSYERTNGSWSLQERFAPSDVDVPEFGTYNLALSGDGGTLLVSTILGTDGAEDQVKRFEHEDGSWAETTTLSLSSYSADRLYGADVALSTDGSTAVVAAPEQPAPDVTATGSAYVFGGGEGEWTQPTELALADGSPEDTFGHEVALTEAGGTVYVTAIGAENEAGDRTGQVYGYEL